MKIRKLLNIQYQVEKSTNFSKDIMQSGWKKTQVTMKENDSVMKKLNLKWVEVPLYITAFTY